MAFEIKSGELKHPIIIEIVDQIENEDNITVDKVVKTINVRAKILNARGSEVKIIGGETPKIERSFYIRYSKMHNIDSRARIKYKGNIYYLSYVNNVEENDKWLELRGVVYA